jgi:microsomal dipeptidase-like Zn-dependent dipeptidase
LAWRGVQGLTPLPSIAPSAGLRARGLSPADVEKILGGNVLRVLEANEQRR